MMKFMHKRISAEIVNVSMLLYMVWLLLPAVQTTCRAVTGALAVMVFGIGVVIDGNTLQEKSHSFISRILMVALLPLILAVFLDRGGSAKAGFYVQQVMFWFPLLWFAYAGEQNNPKLYRWIFPAFFIVVLITALTTIFWLLFYYMESGQFSLYSRVLGNGDRTIQALKDSIMQQNIGGFGFVYMSVLLLPVVAYRIINSNRWKRAGMLAFYVLLLIVIVISFYSYAIILATVITIIELLSALLRRIFRKMSVPVSFVLILPLFILTYLFRLSLVTWAAQIATEHDLVSVSISMNSILDAMNGVIASPSRAYFYKLSADSFLASPLVGSAFNTGKIIGEHSELLDLLAGVGLAGLIGFIGGVWVIGHKAAKGVFQLRRDVQPHLWLQWLMFIVLFSINTVFYSNELSLVMCASIAYILKAEHNRMKA
ncbi:MAG: hypothetical protein JW811_07625 [Clostridiales bacterium]|nr:hypothetical protein [Clostridiales bacterium]